MKLTTKCCAYVGRARTSMKLSKNAVRNERVPKPVSSKNYTDFLLNKLKESCMKVELKISMLSVG